MVGGAEGWRRGGWEGEGVLQKKFPASLFPQLCKGLIKYAWCLEQSRGKWDSTNSTGSSGRPVPLRQSPAVFLRPPPTPPHHPHLPPLPPRLASHVLLRPSFPSGLTSPVPSTRPARRRFAHLGACPPRVSLSLVFVCVDSK